MKAFLAKVVQAIKGKPKQATYVTKMPSFERESDIEKFIDKKQTAHNAELTAEVHRLRSIIEQRKKDKLYNKQLEKAVEKEAVKRKKEQERKKKATTTKINIDPKRQPMFRLRNKKIIGKLIGFLLQEYDTGSVGWFPILKQKVGGKSMKLNVPVFSFEEMFKDKIGYVSQLNGGVVESNYDLTSGGKLIVKEPVFVDESGEKVKIKDISEVEKKQYEDRMQNLRDYINEISYENQQLKLMQVDYEVRIGSSEIEAKTVKREADVWKTKSAFLSETNANLHKQLFNEVSTVQELKTGQVLSDRLATQLARANDKLIHETLKDRFAKGEAEVNESILRRIATEAAQSGARMAMQHIEMTKRVQEPKGES